MNLMTAMPTDEFLAWSAQQGIERSGDCLAYRTRFERFWSTDLRAGETPFFASHVLDGLDPWSLCYVWPRGGIWPDRPWEDRPADQVRRLLLQSIGIPKGFGGALAFTPEERAAVLGIMSAEIMFGGNVDDDLFLVPDHGRQLLYLEHHDLIHVSFSEKDRMMAFENHMLAEGYEKQPDDYFTRKRK